MVETRMMPTDEIVHQRDAFVERLLEDLSGTVNIFSIYIGDRLGLYRALADGGPATSAELARRTNTYERYIREWLEQQTVAGILEVDDEKLPANQRRYRLPPGHVEPLTDYDSLNYLAPLAQAIAGAVRPLPDLLEAYRQGKGIPYSAYGPDLRQGQAAINCPAFLNLLPNEWLPSMKDVHTLLTSDPPARVADIGCGYGWSSIGMALGYPAVRVDGFDLDEPSIQAAIQNAQEMGVSDRVRFAVRDAGDPALTGQSDLVTAFECIHDMSNPVGALSNMRRLAGENGAVLVMDERVSEAFTTKPNEPDWMMYGFSILHCLPVGMHGHDPAGTGTVMREDTLRRYAAEAGFSRVEVLPIDNFFFKFYRLFQD